MELIAISHPAFIPEEAARINRLFEDGLLRLHLRKPACERDDLKRLIEEIHPDFYPRIALHQHHGLCVPYGMKRLHFTAKHRLDTAEASLTDLNKDGFLLSTSVHHIDELRTLSKAFVYTLFGPVFDSISKIGYQRVVKDDFFLKKEEKTVKVIAIGGIDNSNIDQIKDMNFDGAAMLGAIWHSPVSGPISEAPPATTHTPTPSSSLGFRQPPTISRLHFISSQSDAMTHLDSIRLALNAGCMWIQLRVKDRPQADVLRMAIKAKEQCEKYDAKLVINDFPLVAKEIGAYGLHLGLNDMPIPEARKIVGPDMIIGGTANTFENILQRIDEGADYIGLGPFRFTTTKQNLSPILGIAGYRELMQNLAETKCPIPIIAIGGIRPDDIAAILTTGVHGVAMSSALIQSVERKATIQKLQEILC